MLRINLLPHREQKKLAHRKRFQNVLAGALLLALGLSYLGYAILDNRKTHQLERNQLLEQEIARLNEQLKSIEALKQKKSALLTRKELIEKLQHERGQAVRIFDELIRLVPEGVYLKDFRQNGQAISLSGTALSSARVSALMRNIAESRVFADPVLIEVSATSENNIKANRFSLSANLRPPAPAEKGATP